MEKMNARIFGINKGIITLQKDLEFITGVAKTHKKMELFCGKDSSRTNWMAIC
jgi:hypothetical protein